MGGHTERVEGVGWREDEWRDRDEKRGGRNGATGMKRNGEWRGRNGERKREGSWGSFVP